MTPPAPAISQGRQQDRGLYFLLFLLVLAIFISAAYIQKDSGMPLAHPMDQSFISTANLRLGRSNGSWIFQYPNIMYSGGISSSLIAGAYKLIVPTSPETINWHIRILAMTAYLTSSYLLILKIVRTTPLRALGFLTVATSALQFIQPSSELFAGSFLTMFLYAAISRWPFVISSLFLALFGLSKVEMSLAAIALALFWWAWEHRRGHQQAFRAFAYTVLWMVLILIPSFIVRGANPQEMDRSMVAFIFTYAELFHPHQFVANSSSVEDSVTLLKNGLFKNSSSVFDFIRNNPTRFYDYLAVSFFKGLEQSVHTFKFMLVPLALAVVQPSRRLRPLLVMLLIGAVLTLVPAWLFAYVRIRYFVKLFPAVIGFSIANTEDQQATQRWILPVTFLCGIGTIIWQLMYFNEMWLHSHWK